MEKSIILLPEPRHYASQDGTFTLPAESFIFLDVQEPQAVMFAASQFQQVIQAQIGGHWARTASRANPDEEIGLTIRLNPNKVRHHEGYFLSIGQKGILLEGCDLAGIFYGLSTLKQLIIQSGHQLPCLEIEDWPDFPSRGVMLDISRDKVPQMTTLFDLIDRFASWKINQVQLYTEHTFAYRNHPEVWAHASPLSSEEILELDAYCRQRFIELVPNQNSFGHMQRWLRHERYAGLAEKQGEITTPWGIVKGPYGLAPVNPGSLELLTSLYDELLPNFSSRMFNIGCDETFDLGQGQSQDLVAQQGVGRVYLDFLLKIDQEVRRRGFQMQFWGDIILKHPELIPELPKDAIGLLWGYEDNHPFDQQGQQFSEAGIPFYVCPGTSSWCSIAGRTDNAVGNLRNASINGLKHGAVGYLTTDWGDGGHWQMLPISYLGFAVGAAYSWCMETNGELNIPQVVSLFAFDDRSGTMGKVASALGNVYRATGITLNNATIFYRLLEKPLEKIPTLVEAEPEILERAMQAINDAIQPLSQERMARMDANLIRREFLFTARLMRHACYRAYLALETEPHKITAMSQQMVTDLKEILGEYRLLWQTRNRTGGLAESAARLERMQIEYDQKFVSRFLDDKKPAGDIANG